MNKNGQSIIEYAFIAALLFWGFVFMGPYVLRSINAHFKLWDESIQDSFHEKITQAPINEIPTITTSCTCTNTNGACGGSAVGGTGSCAANQRIVNHLCTPVGCDGEAATSCTNDPTCCTTYTAGSCGTIPIGQPNTSTNCNFGIRIWNAPCANLPVDCTHVDSSCNAICQGTVPDPTKYAPCPNEPPESGSLTQNSAYSTVGNQAKCSATQECQYYPYNSACGPNPTPATNRCIPPGGFNPVCGVGYGTDCFGNTCTIYSGRACGCFVAGTKVMLANGQKVSIEHLKAGDILLGSKGAQNKIAKLVIMPQKDWKIYAFNGGRYFVTENHIFKTTTGWKAINPELARQENPQLKIDKLNINDQLLTLQGTMRIKTIKSKIFKDSVVYNPALDNNSNHEYYADDFLVHNKPEPLPSGNYCPYWRPCTEAGGVGGGGGCIPYQPGACDCNGGVLDSCGVCNGNNNCSPASGPGAVPGGEGTCWLPPSQLPVGEGYGLECACTGSRPFTHCGVCGGTTNCNSF